MSTGKPKYDLGEIQRQVEAGQFRISGRIHRFIINRYDGEDPADVVREVVCCIEGKDFHKSDRLDVLPNTFADIYKGVSCDEYPDEEWYVKFAVVDGETVVDVLSCNWDGYIH